MKAIKEYLENEKVSKEGIDKLIDWLGDLDNLLYNDEDTSETITKVDIMEIIRIKFYKNL